MQLKKGEVKTCTELLREFQRREQPYIAEKMVFKGIGDKDVYNITAPFEDDNETVIGGRVESRDDEYSQVYFFINKDGFWVPKNGAPVFNLQDPFITRIAGELVFGGVEISSHPELEKTFQWKTIFYRGEKLSSLKKFAESPMGMKDIRLIELQDGSVGVLTRHQGRKGGRGKIGFTTIKSLDDLTVDVIESAPLLDKQFTHDEWGGANEAHLLSNGLLGILGHIACFDNERNRHYYPMIFALNPETRECSDISLIATRSNFLKGPAKRHDLNDVVFSGGLIRAQDGTATFFAGTSDAEAQKIKMKDPFIKYEEDKHR
ncbi:DUF1861 family protein [Sporolactobacillus sp. THM19-2]|uniref:DUF1861 family protein n=1 Tax=Sporolactobacillus sp. THM19-2 TaxID=2511171 RepID=UPI00101EC7A4|nr:DUF1861 family protein [Sporolactobacillus sp. THM19-2]RYL86662.1 DUF1861 family protein [Sporolactobacillus sp. THM19-2]